MYKPNALRFDDMADVLMGMLIFSLGSFDKQEQWTVSGLHGIISRLFVLASCMHGSFVPAQNIQNTRIFNWKRCKFRVFSFYFPPPHVAVFKFYARIVFNNFGNIRQCEIVIKHNT